jgi:hypothetical protein
MNEAKPKHRGVTRRRRADQPSLSQSSRLNAPATTASRGPAASRRRLAPSSMSSWTHMAWLREQVVEDAGTPDAVGYPKGADIHGEPHDWV